MVMVPKLEVLIEDPPDPELTARTRELLRELAPLLHLPPELVLQVACTHLLAHVQRFQTVNLVVPFELAQDHKRGSGDD